MTPVQKAQRQFCASANLILLFLVTLAPPGPQAKVDVVCVNYGRRSLIHGIGPDQKQTGLVDGRQAATPGASRSTQDTPVNDISDLRCKGRKVSRMSPNDCPPCFRS